MKILTETPGHAHGLPLNPGKQTFSLEDTKWKFVKLHYLRIFGASREGYHPWRSQKLRHSCWVTFRDTAGAEVPRYCCLSFLSPGPRNPAQELHRCGTPTAAPLASVFYGVSSLTIAEWFSVVSSDPRFSVGFSIHTSHTPKC